MYRTREPPRFASSAQFPDPTAVDYRKAMAGTPQLDLLLVFAAVAETGSFSAGAKRLGVPKSTVSRSVARLEESLGVQLLARNTHNVRLTAAGSVLLENASPHLQSLKKILSALPEQREVPAGDLRVTCAPDLAVAWVADAVSRLVLRYPDLRVSLELSTKYVDLVAEGIDVALRIASKPLQDSTLVAKKIATVNFQLFAAPAYLARRGTPKDVDELSEHDWVAVANISKGLGLPVPREREVVRSDEFLVVREALKSGAGIGVLPSYLTTRETAEGSLKRVLPTFNEVRGNLFFVHPEAQHVPPKVRAFREFLVEHLAAKPLSLT